MFTRLSQFYDYNELEAQYADLAEDAGITDKAANNGETGGSWFEPGQALATVRAIHDRLAQHPEDLGFTPDRRRSHWPVNLMEELKDCQATLETASSRGHKFRFLIVP